ncbi:hypothetical protein BLOT_001520, partial [Blomia tropicalis]
FCILSYHQVMMSSVQFVSDDEDVNVDGGGRGRMRICGNKTIRIQNGFKSKTHSH